MKCEAVIRQEAIWSIQDIYKNLDHVDHNGAIRSIRHHNRFLRKELKRSNNKLKAMREALKGLFSNEN